MERKDIFILSVLTALFSFVLFKILSQVQMMPEAAAVEAVYVDHAFEGMLKLTVPIFSMVLAIILYSLFRFRQRAGCPPEEGRKIHGSKGAFMEVAWISISLVLTLGLAAFGAREFRLIRGNDQADLDIQVNSSQWSWDFFYPEFNQYGAGLILPKGKRVRLLLTSKDVVHSFWVPEFRLKQDAVPGKVVRLLFTPTKTGKYILLCAELCGTEHTTMTAWVEVLEPEEFEKRMKEKW